MGLDVWLANCGRHVHRVPSETNPEHMWNKTYLRSSYNQAGFNRVTKNLTGMDLYSVFELSDNPREDEHGVVHVDFQAARGRAVALVNKLLSSDRLYVTTLVADPFEGRLKISPREAVEKFRQVRDGQPADSREFSTRDGMFFLDGLQIYGIVRGGGVAGLPAVHVIHECDDFDWYLEASRILVEFIEYALTLEDPGLMWSS